MQDFHKPIGWDGKDFRETFKTEDHPFITTEEFDWDGTVSKIENRLIWGDNLSVMRSLPSESIDLIYIDPPFFSGRQYTCIFGDEDEVRTFNDIWDGGLPTYLAWMNARLWEMKRLLKDTGQIFVHLDYHAVHYIKVEMDKIFGYDNFRNEIVWHYPSMSATKQDFPRKHDTILRYVKNSKTYNFYADEVRVPYAESTKDRAKYGGAGFDETGGANYLKADGKIPDTVWTIPHLKGKERIGYPTQKPESLIERIIKATTKPGDIVADFFLGGGSTVATAEKLGRKWIGCDISRIAVSVTKDRLVDIYNNPFGIDKLNKSPKFGFLVQSYG
jgi:DNA modification methylase